MEYKIHGTTMQTLDVTLGQGEAVYTESGGMAWMTGAIDMKTDTRGGLLKGLGRKLAGESLFMTTYTCTGKSGMIAFTLSVTLITASSPRSAVTISPASRATSRARRAASRWGTCNRQYPER